MQINGIDTGDYIGYTQGGGEGQKPTLYFENGRFTQQHEDILNVGWHPQKNVLRVNIQYVKSTAFLGKNLGWGTWEIKLLEEENSPLSDEDKQIIKQRIEKKIKKKIEWWKNNSPLDYESYKNKGKEFLFEVTEGGIHPSRGKLISPNGNVDEKKYDASYAKKQMQKFPDRIFSSPLEDLDDREYDIIKKDQRKNELSQKRDRNKSENDELNRLQSELPALIESYNRERNQFYAERSRLLIKDTSGYQYPLKKKKEEVRREVNEEIEKEKERNRNDFERRITRRFAGRDQDINEEKKVGVRRVRRVRRVRNQGAGETKADNGAKNEGRKHGKKKRKRRKRPN